MALTNLEGHESFIGHHEVDSTMVIPLYTLNSNVLNSWIVGKQETGMVWLYRSAPHIEVLLQTTVTHTMHGCCDTHWSGVGADAWML